jgi:V/A-type H+/Na+-transporting ATPase subunit C
MRDGDYIYISSKIRALEPLILDKNDIDRMINARCLATAFQVLNDTDYGNNLLGVEPENFQDALVDDLQQLHDFLQKSTPDQELFKLMMLPRDFVNLKFLFKSKFFNVDVDQYIKDNAAYQPHRQKDMVFESHIISPDEMRAYIQDQKGQTLDQDIKDVIRDVLKKADKKTKPDELDSMLTKHFFALSLKIAEKLKNEFILNYYKMSIDAANLLIMIRSRRLQLSKERLQAKLIPGGQIDTRKIIQSYPDELAILKAAVNANFDSKVSDAYNLFCENKKLFEFERVLENFKFNYIKKIKTKAFGPEVVFAYHLAKINANANTRIILTGKLNEVPIEEIKKTIKI